MKAADLLEKNGFKHSDFEGEDAEKNWQDASDLLHENAERISSAKNAAKWRPSDKSREGIIAQMKANAAKTQQPSQPQQAQHAPSANAPISRDAQSVLEAIKRLEPEKDIPVSASRIRSELGDKVTEDRIVKALHELRTARKIYPSVSDESHMPSADVNNPNSPTRGFDSGIPNEDTQGRSVPGTAKWTAISHR
jgi:hypothetical protein